jgi:hypothetical protein
MRRATFAAMLIFSSNGPRNVPDERVIYVTSEHAPGRYEAATLVLDDGREVSGLAVKEALDRLEARLAPAA